MIDNRDTQTMEQQALKMVTEQKIAASVEKPSNAFGLLWVVLRMESKVMAQLYSCMN